MIRWLLLCLTPLLLGGWMAGSLAASAPDSAPLLEELHLGRSLVAQGKLKEAIETFRSARRRAPDSAGQAAAAAELGAALLQAGRYAEAEDYLHEAYATLSGEARGRIAIDLGNLSFAQRRIEAAARHFQEARTLAPEGTSLWLIASLNLARTLPASQRLDLLRQLRPMLDREPDAGLRARLLLNLGAQATPTGHAGLALAFQALDQAHRLAVTAGTPRLRTEIFDALSLLYESQGRREDVLALTRQGLAFAGTVSSATLEDLLLQLEWRQARALLALDQPDAALAAYQRAVEWAQRVRQDLPIELADGNSSYKQILEPLYLGYIELLLGTPADQPAEREQRTLARVRDAIEMLHQAEMQDFLGDRCTLEEASSGKLEAGTAVLYPVLLADRVELLLETGSGLLRRSSKIPRTKIRFAAEDLASALRNGDADYALPAQALHEALIRPLIPDLTAQDIRTLIVVADGELRLVPFAALRDARGFLVERYAVASLIGMSMTDTQANAAKNPRSLLAGVAEPGEVIDKLAASGLLKEIGRGGTRRSLPGGELLKGRSLRSALPLGSSDTASRQLETVSRLKQRLALPGVRAEVRSIGATLAGNVLLDDAFTIGQFRDEAESGAYRIVHIASHGIFGGTAESSFILAYDDLLSINRLQGVLQSEAFRRAPIELLTLSACETAEGNERAPLGIAGAAIRARAKSVLGTLWPVEDGAARLTMENFYAGLLGKSSKAAALRQAQLQLLNDPNYSHPFFWAPFSLIGNWR